MTRRHHIVEALHEARIRKGMSQVELAKKSGHGRSQISRMERGHQGMQFALVVDVAQALDVTILALPGDSWVAPIAPPAEQADA